MKTNRLPGLARPLIALAMATAATAACALPKTTSANYTINSSSTPGGGAHLSGATFQLRGAAVGITTKAVSTSLPVTVSAFSVE